MSKGRPRIIRTMAGRPDPDQGRSVRIGIMTGQKPADWDPRSHRRQGWLPLQFGVGVRHVRAEIRVSAA